jgi:hypothetical protein
MGADADEKLESVVCDVVATEIRTYLRNQQKQVPATT